MDSYSYDSWGKITQTTGTLAATLGTGGAIAANVAISTCTYVADCALSGEPITAEALAWSVAAGASAGVLGGSGVDAGKQGAIINISKGVVSTTASAAKRTMYQSKITKATIEIAIGAGRTFFSVLVPNIVTAAKERR